MASQLLLALLVAGIVMSAKAEKKYIYDAVTFPTDLPDTLTSLWISGTFDSVNATAFDGLPNLGILTFRSCSALRTMPDVSALAGSLKRLTFSAVQFTEINAEALNAMNKLTRLEISFSPLQSFPVLEGLESLSYLTLMDTEIQCAPRLGHYPNLVRVVYNDNAKMRFCWGDEFDFLTSTRLFNVAILRSPEMTWLPSLESVADSLQKLMLELPGLASMESFTLPPLKSLTSLQIYAAPGSSLERIPPAGATDLSALYFETFQLDLCQCGYLWLKLLAAHNPTGYYVTTTCAEWETTSLDDLLTTCGARTQHPGYKRRYAMTKLRASFFCAFPLHSDLHDVSIIECLETCARTPACFYFNYRPTGGSERGQCVLVAPHSGTQPTVPERSEPGWRFYEMHSST